MAIVLLLLALAVFAALFYGALRLYGRVPEFGRGQIDASGKRVGPADPAAIAWDRLRRVVIVTTDQGPFQDDVFWLFLSADGSYCSLAGGEVDASVFERVAALPGVHHEAIIQAMGSCENARFLVWSAAESAAPVPSQPSAHGAEATDEQASAH